MSPRWTISAPSSPNAVASSMAPPSSRTLTSIGGPDPSNRADHPETVSDEGLVDKLPQRGAELLPLVGCLHHQHGVEFLARIHPEVAAVSPRPEEVADAARRRIAP